MQIYKDMYISDILAVDRNIAAILMEHGLHCIGCLLAGHETLEQACMVHGVDLDAILDDIHSYLNASSEQETTEA
jgi:hybrid cluster-associated redox disulfide protein